MISLAACTVTKVTYGLTISKTDRYKAIAEKSFAVMIHAASPGAFLVDTLPFREVML